MKTRPKPRRSKSELLKFIPRDLQIEIRAYDIRTTALSPSLLTLLATPPDW
jgi:hypothetical protein